MEYLIKTKSIGGMTEEQFIQFCQENIDLRFERNDIGDIIIMEPTGSDTDFLNVNIIADLVNWNRQSKLGYVFGNNAGFTLPNKAVRSPDGAFIERACYDTLPASDRKKFAHICPDFIIEIHSESDQEKVLRDKMEEWMDNGCHLAWMITPQRKETEVFRRNGEREIVPFDRPLDGEEVLPGFLITLSTIYNYV